MSFISRALQQKTSRAFDGEIVSDSFILPSMLLLGEGVRLVMEVSDDADEAPSTTWCELHSVLIVW
jgi:hypothetical protein